MLTMGAHYSDKYLEKHGRMATYSRLDFAPFQKKGKTSIKGQAFCKTKGGDVKYGAGGVVTLVPINAYSIEIILRSIIGKEDLVPPLSDNYSENLRKTIADGEGRFKFKNLPEGDYYVYCDIFWQVLDEETGATVLSSVHLKGKDEKEIMVTPDFHDY